MNSNEENRTNLADNNISKWETQDSANKLLMTDLKCFENDRESLTGEKLRDYFKDHKNEMRTNIEHYLNIQKAFIFSEKQEEEKPLQRFKQTIHLEKFVEDVDDIFRIKIDKNESNIRDGMNSNKLDYFKLSYHGPSPITSGRLVKCKDEYIYVKIANSATIETNQAYEINFVVNPLSFLVQYMALGFLTEHRLFDILINNPKYRQLNNDNNQPNQMASSTHLDQLCSNLTSLNIKQRIAVENIVNESNFPLPYILYGPPGTGKTKTLIAAIEIIVKTSKNNVLVCANSNAACDEITERLMHVLDEKQMLRFYPESYGAHNVKSNFYPFANVLTKEQKSKIYLPPLEKLYDFRVIICTLCTASYLTRARRDEKTYKAYHFSHIIIDESASTQETMILVAIAGLCTSGNQILSSIVLAGDPKQLRCPIKSRSAREMEFDKSLMERLCDEPLYQRNSGKFNEKYITMLVQNYRSHPDILHVPNILFYGGALVARASKDVTDWFIGSELLQSEQFPIIFRQVRGTCKRNSNTDSSFNEKEVDVVIDYIKKLLTPNRFRKQINESDIGVISPYKSQCQHIARRCSDWNFSDVTVGTAEIFQGQEKPIIIVSCVRNDSPGFKSDFLNDPQRMNVMVTRAKALLIIVGNAETLTQNSNWKSLINYCMANGT